jgi:hypothetical protein
VVHPSIVKVPDSSKKSVLEVIPSPQLHLLLGPVNTMYKALAARWEKVGDWLEAFHISREAIHGGSFTGNSCHTLLKKH